VLVILSMMIGCAQEKVGEVVNPQITDAVTIDQAKLGGFSPLPDNYFRDGQAPSPELIALGKRLFNETQLSSDADMSCNTCHDLASNGADDVAFSPGHKGQPVGRNSPTVFNSAGHVAQFWDGRSATVEEQALGPILAAGEMAMPDADTVVRVLKEDATYVADFAKAFPGQEDPLIFQNVGAAIGAFERTLVTPSRWDAYLKGDKAALTDAESRGVNTFVDSGCSGCHSGALIGGSTLMKVGVVQPWPNQADQGKFSLTKSDADKMVFKVPSLRNASLTSPYFHDGSAQDLPSAIKMMGRHQLGKELTDEQANDIAAWLGTTNVNK